MASPGTIAVDKADANKLETKLLLEKTHAHLVHTANIVLAREIGSNRSGGTGFEFNWRTKYRQSKAFEPALEIYWEPGDVDDFKPASGQVLSLGPVISGTYAINSHGKFVYEVGYLRGANDVTPRDTIKWLIEYEYVLGR